MSALSMLPQMAAKTILDDRSGLACGKQFSEARSSDNETA
jgi:hypothetical protein